MSLGKRQKFLSSNQFSPTSVQTPPSTYDWPSLASRKEGALKPAVQMRGVFLGIIYAATICCIPVEMVNCVQCMRVEEMPHTGKRCEKLKLHRAEVIRSEELL